MCSSETRFTFSRAAKDYNTEPIGSTLFFYVLRLNQRNNRSDLNNFFSLASRALFTHNNSSFLFFSFTQSYVCVRLYLHYPSDLVSISRARPGLRTIIGLSPYEITKKKFIAAKQKTWEKSRVRRPDYCCVNIGGWRKSNERKARCPLNC